MSDVFRAADEKRVRALVGRMAGRVLLSGGPPHLIGIRRRGVPLAEMLAAAIRERGAEPPGTGELTLKRYSDDLDVLHETPELREDLSVDVEGADVLLVDDVLYSGRTLLRAVDVVVSAGARRVACAVLCDRGEAELPVCADVVGMRLEMGRDGIVDVHVPPYEDVLEVVLRSGSPD